MRGVSACLACDAVLAYLNAFPGNLLKTCLGNLLKTCLGNSLNTAKHVPISICPPRLSTVASPYAAACRLAVPSRLRFELVKTARFSDSVPPRSPLRSPSRRPVIPIVRPYPHQAVLFPLIAIRLGSPRFSPIEPPPLTPRLTDTQDGEKNGERTVAWRFY